MNNPPTISDDGSVWNLHKAGEDPIRFDVEGHDLSGATVVFRVEAGPTITLENDPENLMGKVLAFSLADLAAIPARGAEFYIRNETSGQVLLTGKVFVRGFA